MIGTARAWPSVRWGRRFAASVAESADAPGLGPGVRKDVEVRLLSLAFVRDRGLCGDHQLITGDWQLTT
jgi:hypothetical protein